MRIRPTTFSIVTTPVIWEKNRSGDKGILLCFDERWNTVKYWREVITHCSWNVFLSVRWKDAAIDIESKSLNFFRYTSYFKQYNSNILKDFWLENRFPWNVETAHITSNNLNEFERDWLWETRVDYQYGPLLCFYTHIWAFKQSFN